MGVLDRIDATLAELCPCGGTPRPGSPYCCDDCVPNYRSTDTTSDIDGTAMRWQPDLVTEIDDRGLTPVQTFPRGRFNASTFVADNDHLHFRLDDGHRFVGVDIDRRNHESGYREGVWQRLERELTDRRRLDPEPADPWADAMSLITERMTRRAYAVPPIAFERIPYRRQCHRCGERNIPASGHREAPDDVIDIRDFGGSLRRTFLNYETCDMCPACGYPHPGPAMVVGRHEDIQADTLYLSVQIGDTGEVRHLYREELVRADDPDDLIESWLRQLEVRVVAAYAREHSDRPDVQEWDTMVTMRQRQLYQHWLAADVMAARITDPRSILRITST